MEKKIGDSVRAGALFFRSENWKAAAIVHSNGNALSTSK
jgi:hypothetical protein